MSCFEFIVQIAGKWHGEYRKSDWHGTLWETSKMKWKNYIKKDMTNDMAIVIADDMTNDIKNYKTLKIAWKMMWQTIW